MASAISVNNLDVSYGNVEVVKGVSFTINRGEIVGYIGPNGAGKSTTIKTLLGIINATSGDILIDGTSITQEDNTYKAKIGYVPEAATLYETLRGQ